MAIKLVKPKRGKKALTSMDVQNKLLGMGCDPIEIMAGICMSSKSDESLKLAAAKELAGYMYSKQRSVDINAEVTQTNITAKISGDKALQAIQELKGKSRKTVDVDAVELIVDETGKDGA